MNSQTVQSIFNWLQPTVSDWVDSLIVPRGLLRSSLQPTSIPVSVLRVAVSMGVELAKKVMPSFTLGVKAKVENSNGGFLLVQSTEISPQQVFYTRRESSLKKKTIFF